MLDDIGFRSRFTVGYKQYDMRSIRMLHAVLIDTPVIPAVPAILATLKGQPGQELTYQKHQRYTAYIVLTSCIKLT
jgi:hypothetical protein